MKKNHYIIRSTIFLLGTFFVLSSSAENNKKLFWMKIKAENKIQRSAIANTGVTIDTVVDDYVYATGIKEELESVKKLGGLEVSFELTEKMDFPENDRAFHNYSELTQELKSLVANHSNIAQMSSIGKSIEGRDIWVVRISGQLDKADQLPASIFMGGHHAREHLSVELPYNYINYLLTEYTKGNPRIVNMLNGRDVHIIPAVNPDGLEFDISTGNYQMWRKNRENNKNGTYGVDLNRNYGFQWGTGGSSTNSSSDVFMGPAPFSEPETQAIKNYVEAHTNISILLSFHTYSELILYPWGHKYESIENSQDLKVHQVMAQKMSEWNHYTPEQSSELYIASGDTTDWSYGVHKIISFTFELDPQDSWNGGGFYPGAGAIDPTTQKNLEPVLYLIDHSDNPYRVLNANGF